jgi:hypothetical protein
MTPVGIAKFVAENPQVQPNGQENGAALHRKQQSTST